MVWEVLIIYYQGSDFESSYVVPEGTEVIGAKALSSCENLTTVSLPDSLLSIEDEAFMRCINLKEISFPDSVTNLGKNPFESCEDVIFKVSPDHQYIAEIDGVLFSKSDKRLIWFPAKEISYVVSEGIQIIGADAFCNCENLTEVTLPASLTTIEDEAFQGCKALLSIIMPSGLISIGNSAFSDCDNLTDISLPDGLQEMGQSAFSSCDNLESIVLPNDLTIIRGYTFSGCVNLSRVVIPTSLSAIGKWAFTGCVNLSEIVLPDSLIAIGSGAFNGCTSLASLTLPGRLSEVGANPFLKCDNVILNVSADNASYGVMDGILFDKRTRAIVCFPDTKESYEISADIESIEDWSFMECTKLKMLFIPDSVTYIGKYAFADCPEFVITVSRDSYAQQYCIENNLKYTFPDANDWLNR